MRPATGRLGGERNQNRHCTLKPCLNSSISTDPKAKAAGRSCGRRWRSASSPAGLSESTASGRAVPSRGSCANILPAWKPRRASARPRSRGRRWAPRRSPSRRARSCPGRTSSRSPARAARCCSCRPSCRRSCWLVSRASWCWKAERTTPSRRRSRSSTRPSCRCCGGSVSTWRRRWNGPGSIRTAAVGAGWSFVRSTR